MKHEVPRVPYVKRMATNEAHAHFLAGEHVMLCKGGLGLGFVEALGVLEHSPRVEIVLFRHSDQM